MGRHLLLRLALAALVSGAAAGLMMTAAALLGATWLGGLGRHSSTGDLAGALAAGTQAGLGAASLPAFVAGGGLWALGARRAAARSAPAWALAGAAAGLAGWALFSAAVRIVLGEPGVGRPDGALLAALLAGSGAALAFRAIARPAWSESR
jgi:hypothetical protein